MKVVLRSGSSTFAILLKSGQPLHCVPVQLHECTASRRILRVVVAVCQAFSCIRDRTAKPNFVPMSFRFSTLASIFAVLFWNARYADAFGESKKFLIVSSSHTHSIAYTLIPNNAPEMMTLRELIPANEGLTFPQGMAVDAWRRFLYVADPTLGKLIGYKLAVSGDDLHVYDKFTVAENVEVRWVAVDGIGNVWFTEEAHHRVMMLSAEALDGGSTEASVVYDGSATVAVDAPSGITADNYLVYWINKLNGAKNGNVVMGINSPGGGKTQALAYGDSKCYGIAMAGTNVYYTDEKSDLFGIPRVGGVEPTKVSSDFEEARGMAFDGMESMYVADKKKNAVYVFPANQPILREGLAMQKVADMQGAYGLVVYTVSQYAQAGSMPLSASLPVLALLALVTMLRL